MSNQEILEEIKRITDLDPKTTIAKLVAFDNIKKIMEEMKC